MSNEPPPKVAGPDLRIETADAKLISTLEQIIKYLKEGNTYTDEDKEMLLYRTEEYVTGKRTELDPEIVKLLFTGWFIHKHCAKH